MATSAPPPQGLKRPARGRPGPRRGRGEKPASAQTCFNDRDLLAKMDRISSVSGGSITAAVLALAWDRLGYGAGTVVAGNFEEVVSRPVRELASRTIDIGAILKAPALLGRRVGPRGGLPTRLAAMDLRLQGRLINWGYAVCDSAVRSFYERDAPTPASLPYPATGV